MRWQIQHFNNIRTAIDGRVVGYIQNDISGNFGDKMIDAGTQLLFRDMGLDFYTIRESHLSVGWANKCDVLALFGSGSVGKICGDIVKRRQRIRDIGKPCILLPSTAFDTCEDLSWCETIFMREEVSHFMYRAVHSNCLLAPDMAMYLKPSAEKSVSLDGVFLRSDTASLGVAIDGDRGDPIEIADTTEEYMRLAARYDRIVTDRLHFGIAALLADRSVDFVPMRWHKLRAMYNTWFKNLPNANWLE